jgi:hypothetical protein
MVCDYGCGEVLHSTGRCHICLVFFDLYRIALAVSQSSLNRSHSVKLAILLFTFTYCSLQTALLSLQSLLWLLLCHSLTAQLPAVTKDKGSFTTPASRLPAHHYLYKLSTYRLQPLLLHRTPHIYLTSSPDAFCSRPTDAAHTLAATSSTCDSSRLSHILLIF